MSESCIIAEMANALIDADIDLGDERAVELALLYGTSWWRADIDQHMHAAIDRARALRAGNMELTR